MPVSKSAETQRAEMQKDIKFITEKVKDIDTRLKDDYAKKHEVTDNEARIAKLESLRDWIGRIILTAVVGGLLALLGLR